MQRQLKRSRCAIAISVVAMSGLLFGQRVADTPGRLLDRLAGQWVLEGKLGGKQVTHDVTAEWVLNHEYLRVHEISREKNRSGDPAYEAIIFFAWDAKAQEYRCLWLDNTDGRGLSVPIARGKRIEQAIQIAFPPPFDSIHTTFKYDDKTDQ